VCVNVIVFGSHDGQRSARSVMRIEGFRPSCSSLPIDAAHAAPAPAPVPTGRGRSRDGWFGRDVIVLTKKSIQSKFLTKPLRYTNFNKDVF